MTLGKQAHRPMYGESGYARRVADAYWTPTWCVDVLLRHMTPRGVVWEPACGSGNICEALAAHGLRAIATDLNDWGYGTPGRDFLTTEHSASAIITNPPYEISDKFVARALDLMRPAGGQVAMLLRNEWDSAASRAKLLHRLCLKLVLMKRPRWSEDDKASPRHNFAWFVWDFASTDAPRIKWDRP